MIQKTERQKVEGKLLDFNFEAYQQKVITGLINGKPLTSQDGLLKPLIAKFIQEVIGIPLQVCYNLSFT